MASIFFGQLLSSGRALSVTKTEIASDMYFKWIPWVHKLQDILSTLWAKGTPPYYGPCGLQKRLLVERLTLYL